MLKAIAGLYKNISSQALVNGNLSDPFMVKSGVRQGRPLSPLAFIAVVKPLLQRIQLS